MPHSVTIRPLRNKVLPILVILFPFCVAQNNTNDLPKMPEEIIGVTSEDRIETSNSYAKYIFGLPPIPVDPSIPEVEKDDDFETLAPFTRDQIYNKNWFISGFDNENRPIVFRIQARVGDAASKLHSNSTALALLRKAARYRKYIIKKAMQIRSTKEKPVTQYILFNDFIHTNSYSALLTNPLSIRYIIHSAAIHRKFNEKYLNTEIYLNVGVVGELAARLLGRVGLRRRRLKVYGPNKAEWLPALQKMFLRDQLPEEYGGLKGHVPVKLYPD